MGVIYGVELYSVSIIHRNKVKELYMKYYSVSAIMIRV